MSAPTPEQRQQWRRDRPTTDTPTNPEERLMCDFPISSYCDGTCQSPESEDVALLTSADPS